MNTLVTSLAGEVVCYTELEKRKLESCLAGLSSVSAAMGSAQELGMHQLRNTAVKPRIATWLDTFLTLSHTLTEVSSSAVSKCSHLLHHKENKKGSRHLS